MTRPPPKKVTTFPDDAKLHPKAKRVMVGYFDGSWGGSRYILVFSDAFVQRAHARPTHGFTSMLLDCIWGATVGLFC